jgi:hypothetical protein
MPGIKPKTKKRILMDFFVPFAENAEQVEKLSGFWGFDFDRLRSAPFEGAAIVKPPALPEDSCLRI